MDHSTPRHVVLLLTASVNISNMVFTELKDASIREQHYLEAIVHYYQETDISIVVVENTGHDFSPKLPASIGSSNRIELLSYAGNNFPKEKGKGYGELELMSYALQHSKLIKDDTSVIKVTGRYKVINIKDFVRSARNPDYHACQASYFRGQRKAFSGIFTITKSFITDYFLKNHELMNDTKGIYFEHVLADTFLDYLADGHDYSLLPSYPRIAGISGTDNLPHKTNNYIFWLRRNIIYKIVRVNYNLLDKVIKIFFQG